MHEQDTSPIEADPIVAAVVAQEVEVVAGVVLTQNKILPNEIKIWMACYPAMKSVNACNRE